MLTNMETFIIQTLQSVFDQFGWLGVAALMALDNATGISPNEIILGLAGWMLIEAHGLPISFVLLGGLFAAIGSTIGASAAYWAARLGGRPLVQRVAGWFRFDMAHIDRVEAMFNRRGTRLVFFGRMMPGLRNLVSIPAGLTRMNFGVFVLATLGGTYIWCTVLIGAGYILGVEWPLISQYVKQFAPLILLAGAAAVGVAAWIWLGKRQNRLRVAETAEEA